MSEKNENLRSNLANFIKKAKEDKIVSYEEINSILSIFLLIFLFFQQKNHLIEFN